MHHRFGIKNQSSFKRNIQIFIFATHIFIFVAFETYRKTYLPWVVWTNVDVVFDRSYWVTLYLFVIFGYAAKKHFVQQVFVIFCSQVVWKCSHWLICWIHEWNDANEKWLLILMDRQRSPGGHSGEMSSEQNWCKRFEKLVLLRFETKKVEG